MQRSHRRPLATLGEGHIAYVKQIRRGRAGAVSPGAKIAPGLKLFALHAADGTPIMLTDSREAAIANAWSNELQASAFHDKAMLRLLTQRLLLSLTQRLVLSLTSK